MLMRVPSARQEKCQESPGKGNIQVIWVAALEFWVVHLIWNKTPVNGWNKGDSIQLPNYRECQVPGMLTRL